jgi:acid phosphatase
MGRRWRGPALAAALALLAGCGSGGGPAAAPPVASSSTPGTATPAATSSVASASPAAGLPSPAHVVVVVFENKDADAVVGAADAPYLTSLAAQGATFTDAHGVTHPSQPNYLALFSGSTQGVTDDSCPQSFRGPNLAGQLRAAGHTFTGFSEGLPAAGYTGCRSGEYARKHNPWVDFADLPASVNQPYSALPADLGQLPTVAFVVPNLCDDMHDCPVKTGDDWARAHLAAYVSWARDHDSLLIVTFDEDENTAANRIATFLVGPMVRPGTSDQRIDHYSVLRTIEEMYGLPPLGEAANREPITGIWTAG